MKQFLPLSTIVFAALAAPSRCMAQNVSGYGMIPEPFLFLLREPAVHDDLGLTRDQRNRLVEINHSFDGILLATRNMPPEKGQEKIAEVMTETREQVAKLFSGATAGSDSTNCLSAAGYFLCSDAPCFGAIAVDARTRRNEIEAIVKETLEKISELQTATYQGKEAHRKSQDAMPPPARKSKRHSRGAQRRPETAAVGLDWTLLRPHTFGQSVV